MIWTNCAKSTISTEPARITNHHESGNVPPTDLESGFLSLSMQNSPIGRIASLMWLRPLSRLAVVQNVQGTVRSTTSALQAASENERTQKTNQTRHHCYQTSAIVDIIVIRRVEVWVPVDG